MAPAHLLGLIALLPAARGAIDVVKRIEARALVIEADYVLSAREPHAVERAKHLLREAISLNPEDRDYPRMLDKVESMAQDEKAAVPNHAPMGVADLPPLPPLGHYMPLSSSPPPPTRTAERSTSTAHPAQPLSAEAALAKINEAIQLQRKDADNFVVSRRVVELYTEALEGAPWLAQADPSVAADVMSNLGVALRSLDRTDEAIERQREAVRLMPSECRHSMNLAGTLYTAGDMAGAASAARQALECNPMNAKAMNIWASVEPIRNSSDPRISTLEMHAAAVDRLSIEERTLSHFDLFRAYDKLKVNASRTGPPATDGPSHGAHG